ncbi:MAG TPA: DUF1127 domain-containing protein [Xanthobacteraceae bacterium]|jgi:uncharacterized protein YjiS (DUF1127 family)|nr:DUF1127 domain-containing protein [Xanthobacteraceae bacterium]
MLSPYNSDSELAIARRGGGFGGIRLSSLPRLRGRIRVGAQRISYLLGALELALQVRRERRVLMGMDERMLKDLGLNGIAYREGSRPLWDVPRERMAHLQTD